MFVFSSSFSVSFDSCGADKVEDLLCTNNCFLSLSLSLVCVCVCVCVTRMINVGRCIYWLGCNDQIEVLDDFKSGCLSVVSSAHFSVLVGWKKPGINQQICSM